MSDGERAKERFRLAVINRYLRRPFEVARVRDDVVVGESRAPSQSTPTEAWVQRYVKTWHRRLGFQAIEGPFRTGPDFRGKRAPRGRWTLVEVEVVASNYVKHGHATDPAFADVDTLIVLEKARVSATDGLPPNLVTIDRRHFDQWYLRGLAKYAATVGPRHQAAEWIRHIADAFAQRWLRQCQMTGDGFAECPRCQECPHLPASVDLWRVAEQFIFEKFSARTNDAVLEALPTQEMLDEYFVTHVLPVLRTRRAGKRGRRRESG